MASQPTATTKTNAAAASPSTTKTNTTAATTTTTAAPQGHPPYADMIKAALVALNERNGSSRKAIAKYIESNYSHFSDKHDALIAVMLKKMKESGKLVMVKKSYKLPAASSRSIPVASGDVSKKKMGRPFKNREAQVDNSGDAPARIVVPFATEVTTPENRKSGRPHSKTKTTEAGQSSGAANGGGSTLFVSLGPEVTPARKQPVGKPKSVSATKSNKEGTKKRMGRPPKNGPEAEVPGSAGPGSVNIQSKRRGRRPGASPAGAQTRASPLTTPVRSPTTAGHKRRGRRPGTANKPDTPVARPEKNGGAGEADAGESSAAYTSLKRKFEYLQARVKETVSAVKPRLKKEGEEEATIGRQLTDLEELATVLSP